MRLAPKASKSLFSDVDEVFSVFDVMGPHYQHYFQKFPYMPVVEYKESQITFQKKSPLNSDRLDTARGYHE